MIEKQLTGEELKWFYKILCKIDFFSEIPLVDIDSITQKFFRESLPTGKVKIKQGAMSDALYIIKSGSCTVTRKKGLFAKQTQVAVLKEGDFFGEMSVLFNLPAYCSVTTVEPTELFAYLKSDFQKLLDSNSSLRDKVMHIAEIRKYEDLNK
ncbi:MAG: hypothetical protein A2452_05115 [Candidatus Firestonebacteria bacterium RIFOXYC2_FULL_39_67]|nr:MAG: hypothetical protein A2536_10680 [Candidatus Firestonebacteria bacterium RIFOXYD2_FULL_39_29]OGF53039.1 MAG: hypothetical protein A2497_02575 [Candidatus Firestonebacteria bacterium RifOxyC12_full_39_7]OGF54505.1 MAG: hypothetical protein A2452_05115 [Candidatus Firestonebacteria bacterium RIFOXYC2_FULL_39_67]